MDYISLSTYEHYERRLNEQNDNLKEILWDDISSSFDHSVSSELSLKNSQVEVDNSIRDSISEVLKNNVITEKNIEFLRREKWIWYEYEVEVFDKNGNKQWEKIFKVGWLYPLKENVISYKSPVWKELYKILKSEVDFEEWNFEDLDLMFELENWISYKVLSIKKTDENL